MILFDIFANLFKVWLSGRQLDSQATSAFSLWLSVVLVKELEENPDHSKARTRAGQAGHPGDKIEGGTLCLSHASAGLALRVGASLNVKLQGLTCLTSAPALSHHREPEKQGVLY